MTLLVQTSTRVSGSAHEEIIETALQLYALGLNVFPVMHPHMLKLLYQVNPVEYPEPLQKRPFQLEPFFYARYHLCTEECRQYEEKTGRVCRGRNYSAQFPSAFSGHNLGLMLGRISAGMVCLDCDSHSAYEVAKAQFQQRRLDHWSYTSSRGGNILFRCADGILQHTSHCAIPEAEVLSSRHFCVLPPSVHPSGCLYEWDHFHGHLPAAIAFADLQWLGVRLEKDSHTEKNLYGLPEWTEVLSERNRRILAGIQSQGVRNQSLTKPCYDIAYWINREVVSYQEGFSVLCAAANRCDPPYPIASARQMLDSALQKPDLSAACEYYGIQHTIHFDPAPFLQWAKAYDWRTHGRNALTDRTVFVACCLRACQENDLVFRATTREMAQICNIQQPTTISKALRRLCTYGFLEKAATLRNGAHQYTLEHHPVYVEPHINTTCKTNVLFNIGQFHDLLPLRPLEQNVFRGIGMVGWLVWQHLRQHPGDSASQISDTCHLHLSSIYSSRNKLLRYGLVTYSRAEGVYLARIPKFEEMEEIVALAGKQCNSEFRERNFRVEREVNTSRLLLNKIQQINQQIATKGNPNNE